VVRPTPIWFGVPANWHATLKCEIETSNGTLLPVTTPPGRGERTASCAPVSALIMCEPVDDGCAGTAGLAAVLLLDDELLEPQPAARSVAPASGTTK
jgi:hypothetical protein